MKKSLYITLAIVLAVFVISAPVVAKKAGKVKDDVYTDNNYKFSFKIPTGWSTKISKSKKPDRIILTQKSYAVPQQFQGGAKGDYAQIPTIIVIADTTSLKVDEFVDSLLDDKFKSDQKKYFMRKLKLISKSYEIMKRREITVAGAKSIQIEARQQYTIEIPQAGSDKADVVTDFKGGAIFFTVRDGRIFIIYMIYEWYYNKPNLDLFYKRLIPGLKFE